MSFTRLYDDLDHIKQNVNYSKNICDYMLNKPGNGLTPSYMDDPFIRIQEWGGNLRTNTINIDSDLKGLTRPINNRDGIAEQNYQKHSVSSSKINYPTDNTSTDQSRATHPAWEYREKTQMPLDNNALINENQKHTFIPFQTNQHSRILEKDLYEKKHNM